MENHRGNGRRNKPKLHHRRRSEPLPPTGTPPQKAREPTVVIAPPPVIETTPPPLFDEAGLLTLKAIAGLRTMTTPRRSAFLDDMVIRSHIRRSTDQCITAILGNGVDSAERYFRVIGTIRATAWHLPEEEQHRKVLGELTMVLMHHVTVENTGRMYAMLRRTAETFSNKEQYVLEDPINAVVARIGAQHLLPKKMGSSLTRY